MRKLFLILFSILSSVVFSQEEIDWSADVYEVKWHTDFTEAKLEAKTSNKPLVMYLTGSDWCSPCKRLKKDFFESEAFIEKSKELVLLKVDLPFREDIITPEQRIKNQKLSKKFNPKKTFPLLVGFNSSGREISRISSYSGDETRYHFDFIQRLLNGY